MIDDPAEIIANARMIGTKEAIGFPGASAAVPGQGVPGSFLKGNGHSPDVFGGRFSFESVSDNGEAFVVGSGPIEIQKIAVIELQSFAVDGWGGHAAE